MDRVQKLIAHTGLCSRRKAEELIEAGEVKVNGQVITLGDKAEESDKIEVNGKLITFEKKVYLAFHKPKFVLTALGDESDRPSVQDFITTKERIYPTGRLDYNAEGLLILTNDGDFANIILHPSHEIQKEYQVWLDKPFHNNDLSQLKRGVKLKDGFVKADNIRVQKNKVDIAIHEGRHKIVKRMFKEVGYHVDRLIRTRVGPVTLGNLKEGKTRPLLPIEIEKIRNFDKKSYKQTKKPNSTKKPEEKTDKKKTYNKRPKKESTIIKKNA